MPKTTEKKIPELRVVFDTSVLYTQVAYDLMKNEVRKLIEANSKHVDLRISWYLPSVVIDERRYQMRSKAYEFLPTIDRIERLLGHNLNITEDILATRVNEAIEKQLGEQKISILEIDTTVIDWKALIDRSVNRHPPFKTGEHEKGFRDALIAETFLQLVKQSPTTPTVCRLAVVTNDELLKKYITESTKDAKNVRVLSDVSELESLINTLVSEVTEEFVKDLKEKAAKLFFEKETDTSLFYKEKIWNKILESYGKELQEVPKEGLLRENGTWRVSEPVFIKKEKQRIFWMTAIEVDAKLFKYEWPEVNPLFPLSSLSSPPSGFSSGLSSGFAGSQIIKSESLANVYMGEGFKTLPKKTDIGKGRSRFEIHWSTSITQAKKLTSPHIEKILFAMTKWDEE